jgi:hypothetical protein
VIRPGNAKLSAVPTFPRGYVNHALWAEHAKLIAQLARETDGNLKDEREKLHLRRATQADSRSVRGWPAVGSGCPSAIHGTDPLRALLAKEARGRRRD